MNLNRKLCFFIIITDKLWVLIVLSSISWISDTYIVTFVFPNSASIFYPFLFANSAGIYILRKVQTFVSALVVENIYNLCSRATLWSLS
jgi:hypothetical protein